MSGITYVIGEILVFLVAATLIGFVLGRVTKRAPSGRIAEVIGSTEMAESRELILTLEYKLEEALQALEAAEADQVDGELIAQLETRLAEATSAIERLEAENAGLRDSEAPQPRDEATDAGADDAEVERLRAELEATVAEMQRLEALVAASEDVAPAAEDASGDRAADEDESAGDGKRERVPTVGWTSGSGFADTLIEFD